MSDLTDGDGGGVEWCAAGVLDFTGGGPLVFPPPVGTYGASGDTDGVAADAEADTDADAEGPPIIRLIGLELSVGLAVAFPLGA